MLNKALLMINTIKYLKFSQILNRVKRRLIKLTPDLLVASSISLPETKLSSFIQCQEKMLNENELKFLNVISSVQKQEDWNSDNHEKLWLYNLHYFDDLNGLHSKNRTAWHINLIQRWISENPFGFGNGWEPYPTSLRIVNWTKWFLLNNNVRQEWLDSLAIQTRSLSQNLEYHLLGNHLFTNAKALIFAGLFFKGEEANNWYRTGKDIVDKELIEQVLPDGGNFELSPMYHSIFLEDLLDLVNVHQAYSVPLPENFRKKIVKMIEWLKVMCHPDKEIAFFNDSAHGIAPSLEDLLSYAKRLNIECKDSRHRNITHLKESGYMRLDINDLVIIADLAKIGPDYIPGHGHADTLSFEMSLFGKRMFVNSGTSTYEANNERHKQRGTLLHSTITVDGENSSQVWGVFRVARRARPYNIKSISKGLDIKFSACHDGYKRLKGKPVHCREWSVFNNSIEIEDRVTGNGKHKIRSVLPLHPEVKVSDAKENLVYLVVSGKKIKVHFEGEGVLRVEASHYYPEFGLSVDNKCLIYDYNGIIPFKMTVRVSW